MQYEIYATLSNGVKVFDGTMGYVPHKGEEIEIGCYVFIVENVRYVLNEGTQFKTSVKLQLAHIK